MPFKKGQGGRPRGARNRASIDIQAICRAMVENAKYRDYFEHRLNVGQLPPALEVMAWHYAFGKPQEHVDVTGDINVNTRVVHEHPGT